MNHIKATGANKKANLAVPKRWLTKRTTNIAIEMGIISWETEGLEIAIPATADVTDTAGVNMPSAIVKLVPNRHHASNGHRNVSLSRRDPEFLKEAALLTLSPVSVRSASKSLSSGGKRPWNNAKVPPSPEIKYRM
jgi:hypothetical protein